MPAVSQQTAGHGPSNVLLFFRTLTAFRNKDATLFVKRDVFNLASRIVGYVNQKTTNNAFTSRRVIRAHWIVQLHWRNGWINRKLLSLLFIHQ